MEKKDARNFKLKLLDEMKNGRFAQCDRLPRETELAELLGISLDWNCRRCSIRYAGYDDFHGDFCGSVCVIAE